MNIRATLDTLAQRTKEYAVLAVLSPIVRLATVVVVPGHALHEKNLRRQIGDGSLVSSEERKAAVVLRINRVSTADKPRINSGSRGFVPPSIYIIFRSFFRRDIQTVVFDAQEGKRDGCPLVEPTRRRPVLPGPAPPRRLVVCRPAPARPELPLVCPGFGFDRFT